MKICVMTEVLWKFTFVLCREVCVRIDVVEGAEKRLSWS
jgi:hypothetical protein